MHRFNCHLSHPYFEHPHKTGQNSSDPHGTLGCIHPLTLSTSQMGVKAVVFAGWMPLCHLTNSVNLKRWHSVPHRQKLQINKKNRTKKCTSIQKKVTE